jgi:hypothetical protein
MRPETLIVAVEKGEILWPSNIRRGTRKVAKRDIRRLSIAPILRGEEERTRVRATTP